MTSSKTNYELWTVHPDGFRLNDPQLHIDPAKGYYLKDNENLSIPFYKQSLIKLQQPSYLNTDQILWCYTDIKAYTHYPKQMVEFRWALDVPSSQITFIDDNLWNNIIRTNDEVWDKLILSPPVSGNEGISALVKWTHPKRTEWIKCCERLPSK